MSWRMKLAFLIAGKELDKWNSRNNRLASAMATSMAEERIIKLLEFPNGWHETVYVAGEGDEHFASSCVTCLNIALIKGEQK